MMDEAFEHAQRTNLLLGGHDADWCEKHVKSRLVFAKLRGERLRAKQEKQEALRDARWAEEAAEEAAMEADRDKTFFKITLYGGQGPLRKQPDEDGNYPHIQHSSHYFNDDDEETCYEMVFKWAQALGLKQTGELQLFLVLEMRTNKRSCQPIFEYHTLDMLRDFDYEMVEDVVPGRYREMMSLCVQGLAWPEQLPPSSISQLPKQQPNSPSTSTTGPKEGECYREADQEPQSGEV
jgi:hypothetical protein